MASQIYFACPICGKEYEVVTKKSLRTLVFTCTQCSGEIKYTKKRLVAIRQSSFVDRDYPISSDDVMNIKIALEVGDFWKKFIE